MTKNNELEAVSTASEGPVFPWRLLVLMLGCVALVVGMVVNMTSEPRSVKEAIGAVLCAAGCFAFGVSFLFPKDKF
ncbi:hypothetical protein [Comamonas testosteroni]|uniref:hypothetical protein n=1 Tax=Comamonas testosteroni TaxID=285 RepID=UPI0012D36FAC|nr:hypothetical protein [Comamonas testosteroni]